MSMIIRVPGVDWSGKGFPNISPFVAAEDLDFGYDFASRSNRLKDISGNHADLVPYRHDIAGGVIRTQDASIVVDDSDGLGILVELGYLLTDIPMPTIPINGTMQFTVMVAGGYSGVPFPAAKVAVSNPSIAAMIDFGTGVAASGFDLEVSTSEGKWGSRIKSAAIGDKGSAVSPISRKCVGFLTFDGSSWVMHNKTLGSTISKSNADLGITSSLVPNTTHVNKVVIGHYHSTITASALYPSLYQVAKWNRVLTADEIAEQYERTKANKPGVGL